MADYPFLLKNTNHDPLTGLLDKFGSIKKNEYLKILIDIIFLISIFVLICFYMFLNDRVLLDGHNHNSDLDDISTLLV